MRKVVLTFGIISGLLVMILMYLSMPFGHESYDFEMGEILGYTSMIISLSAIFFGIKVLRDRHQGGMITYKRGFLTGLYITLIAAVMYASGWEVYYRSTKMEFMEQYTAYITNEMKEEGKPQAEIDEKKQEMAKWGEYYKNPAIRFGMTLGEILPVGILVSLISAAILRRKTPKIVNE